MGTAHRRHRTPVAVLALFVLAFFGLVGCGDDDDALPTTDDVDADAIQDDAEGAQSSLSQSLEDAGLGNLASAVESIDISELTDSEEFTFFAPNDEAFLSLPANEAADLLTDLDGLRALLQNHVVGETLMAADLADVTSVQTEAGNTLSVSSAAGTVTVGGATVVSTDHDVDNGVIHTIDQFLLPNAS